MVATESSVKIVVFKLPVEAEGTPLVTIGFGNFICCWSSDECSRCTDLLKAKVDFMVTASESLLSDGRRDRTGSRGNGDGQSVCLGSTGEESDTADPLREELTLAPVRERLWLLSVRLSSLPGF